MIALFTENLPLFLALVFAFLVLRYALVAGLAFAFATVAGRRYPNRRIQKLPVAFVQLRREIGTSILSSAIFAFVFAAVLEADRQGLTQLYRDVGDHGWLWFALSIPLMVLIHDFYFYVIHRLMHTKLLFERVHRVHHLSTNPTPFAAFAFHPIEAVLEAGILVLLVTIMPVHIGALLAFFLISLIFNVIGHLGFEIYPAAVARAPYLRWLNTATYHNAHHRMFNANYGYYTVIWDRLFGTLSSKSEARFLELTAPHRAPAEAAAPLSAFPAASGDAHP